MLKFPANREAPRVHGTQSTGSSGAAALEGNADTWADDGIDVAALTVESAMVPRMRLLLAASVLMTILVDSSDMDGINRFAWLVAAGYLLHSLVIYSLLDASSPVTGGRVAHWCDVGWCALIVATTGGIDSIFFLLFFFAILTVSFRYGLEEGSRITVASTALFGACTLLPGYEHDLPRLLMRITFLLGFGYMSARWGESRVRSAQRLALLRDVGRLSNPRFGIDRTITSALLSIVDFFRAQSCLVVLRDAETGECLLRTVKAGSTELTSTAEPIHEHAARRLLAMPAEQICIYSRPAGWRAMLAGRAAAMSLPGSHGEAVLENLAGLLEADTLLSVPLNTQRGSGRLFVIANHGRFSRNDALFLNHVVTQAFAMIDNIDLLDCIASNAAAVERRKIGWNLHDAAIQPYVGLQLGLSAVRNKATIDNPLVEDLDRLLLMANEVINDLRSFAGRLSRAPQQHEPVFLEALRGKVSRVKDFHGIDVNLIAENTLGLSDRVAAEALHIVGEGLNNICKHTNARRAWIQIGCKEGVLRVHIENDGPGNAQPQFVPRSIAARARSLGGKVAVKAGATGGACVYVEIPI